MAKEFKIWTWNIKGFFFLHKLKFSADKLKTKTQHCHFSDVLTSAGVGQFGPAEEAQVSSPSPDGLRVSEAESGVEMVRLQRLVSIHGEVPAGVVATVHPDLHTQDVSCSQVLLQVFLLVCVCSCVLYATLCWFYLLYILHF